MDLSGKTVVLTGASGGIGRALARELAGRGARLVLMGRNRAALDELADALPESPRGPHATLVADLDVADDRADALAALAARDEPIDVLINNAGVSRFALLEDTSEAQLESLVHGNLISPMLLTRSLLPLLNPARAQVVNVGSAFGAIGYPGYAGYCASKFGLRGFTEALSRELADTNTVVQHLAPRATRTPINSGSAERMNAALGNHVDSAEWVAAKLARAIERETRNVTLGWPEKLFVRVNAVLGALVDRSIRKRLPTIKRFAQER